MIKNPVPWPNGAKCAVSLTFDMDADSFLHLHRPHDSYRRVSTISSLRYGPEIGVERIVETYAELGIRQTFFVPSWCIETYPHAVEKMLKAGHEVAHHGYIHEHYNEQPGAEQEAYWMDKCIDIIEKFTGNKPRGFRAPLYNFSENSAEMLAERNFLYDASCMGDDVPYLMKTKKGDVLALPTPWACDDWPPYVQIPDINYMMQIQSPETALKLFRSEFEAQYEYGGLFILTCHPFVTGRLARWMKTAEFLKDLRENYDVWFAPMEEIAQYVLELKDQGKWQPREETQPYYSEPVRIS